MAHKNIYGKIILSAGEVGSYTTCPEAWRLEILAKAKPVHTDRVEAGEELHKEWSTEVDEAMYFTRSIKLILLLTVLLVLSSLLRWWLGS